MNRIVACDPGTMFFQFAEKNKNGKIDIKTIRNCFVELESSDDNEEILNQNNWQYVRDGKKYFVFGSDAMQISMMFPKTILRRPMQNGVLNKGENKKMLVIAKMIESYLGEKSLDGENLVCFCVSGECIDNKNIDNIFHQARMEGIFKNLGWKTKVISEGMAVVLNMRPVLIEKDGTEAPYSGIGISFGSGRTNISLAFKGMPILSKSLEIGGDWIDKKVSEQTDFPQSIITNIKETKLDFNNIDYDNDAIFALTSYYSYLIKYVFNKFAEEFQKVKSQFETPIDICLAGGTSCPPGFRDKVEEVVRELDLPFKIKDIIQSKDPRNSVVKGLLTQAIITQKKLEKEKTKTEEF